LPKAGQKSKIVDVPTARSQKDDVRELMKTSDKTRATMDKIKARKPAPKNDPVAAAALQASIREKRAKEAEERKRANAAQVARAAALRAPKPTVTGEGSGMRGISGVQGKDHAPQKSEILVNSSSEDEDDSEDDAAYLAHTAAAHKRGEDVSAHGKSLNVINRPVKKAKIQRSAKDMRARLIPPMDQLHQAILEWDIFHEGDEPPNGFQCLRVANSYDEPSQYMETFLPLLINEAWRSFVTDKAETTSKPFGIKVVNRMSVDKFIEVSTAMPIAENKDKFLSEGDIVLLSVASKPLEVQEDPHCLARIWRTQFKNGSLEISYRISGRAGPILPLLTPGAELYAVKITNMTTIEREYASLKSLQYYDLMQEILEARPSPMLKFGDEAVSKVMKNYHLNPGQAKAILNAKENDAFTLVQG
jgi:senataxin